MLGLIGLIGVSFQGIPDDNRQLSLHVGVVADGVIFPPEVEGGYGALDKLQGC